MNMPAATFPAVSPVPVADVAKTLGNPQRLALLERAAQGEQSVEKLAEHSGLSISNASQHLQHLRRAGLVRSRRSGKHILYRLGDGPIAQILTALQQHVDFQQTLIRQAVIDSREKSDDMEAVSINELLKRMSDGSVVVIDVRPDTEYSAAHLPGAVSIPVKELAERLQEIPNAAQIVAYCRDPYCVLSVEAVALLRAQGKDAQRLAGGIAEWIAAGHKVETGR